ncbi:hypothetical protein [Rhodococcus cercidiphylli]|uniref:Uncharacterized protein n=1 Tax=Rhodococcus cercidiphylli TaxID=489916 RepID=A0ABU4AWB8_9NOCA|nr:hypothetical protein [Rhodococcus cercidiphylli]MDV6230523.1 hypothetical protein [Rhodococcus cercidiphylli]
MTQLPIPDKIDGTEWQRLCFRMLRQHHGVKLVEVPDRVGGDAGLDAFTTDGIVYQSYAPEEPLTQKQRYEKQRAKMTTDVGKFITNRAKIEKLFAENVNVKHWVLLVPRIDDRKIIEHAIASQTSRLRAEALPYASADIVVTAETADSYADSYLAVVSNRLAELKLPPPRNADFSKIASADFEKMTKKLDKVPEVSQNKAYRDRLLNKLMTSYLASRDQRSWMADHLSELDSDLEDQLSELELIMESEYPLQGDAPGALLSRVMAEARERVTAVAPSMKPLDRANIAQGQVADWLMRCPLDFFDSDVV